MIRLDGTAMKSWLVTGGCGFIGSHLAHALIAGGDRVRILDDLSTGRRENAPREAEIVIADVADRDVVQSAIWGMDGCFHLAAVASVERATLDWMGAHRANLTGTIAVFEAARRASADRPPPIVYASSAAVYGACGEIPLTESTPAQPLSAYAADKAGSEMHAKAGWIVHRLPSIGLRLFNVFGPRQDPSSPYSGVIAVFADRLARRKPVVVHGDGGQTRDFIYVDDVVRFMLAAMERGSAGARVFNVCTGRATSIIALAKTLSELIGGPLDYSHAPPRPGDIRASVGDPLAAEAALGVRPQIELRQGLARLLASVHVASGAALP